MKWLPVFIALVFAGFMLLVFTVVTSWLENPDATERFEKVFDQCKASGGRVYTTVGTGVIECHWGEGE